MARKCRGRQANHGKRDNTGSQYSRASTTANKLMNVTKIGDACVAKPRC
jgi:hypothetical protein